MVRTGRDKVIIGALHEPINGARARVPEIDALAESDSKLVACAMVRREEAWRRIDRTGAPVKEVEVVIVKKLWSVKSALRGLRDVARGLLLHALRILALRVEHPKVVLVALLGRGCLSLVGQDLRALRTVNISGSVHLLAGAESHCGGICER